MDWSQRRAVMKELNRLPVRERGRLLRDYAAGRPVTPEKLALLRRWAPAYPPYGWIQIGVSLGTAAFVVAPVLFGGTQLSTLEFSLLVLLLVAICQSGRNLRCAARLRREAELVPAEPAA